MYKVVIIDDEPVIVKGLSRLMPWEEYDCEVVGTASDGLEGLELIRNVKPHIVFSDIYMPRLNGLMMAAALKSEFEDLELTILTGYRDFELVQQALNIGVCRFVLKPSDMEELKEALEAMILKLKKRGIMPETKETEDLSEQKTEEQTELQTEQGQEDEAGNFLVKNALKYMQSHFERKLTLAEVAERIFVSQWHLSKLLNKHTGQSFSDLLNTIRIERAKELLKDPSLRVGDVAEKVGFLDIAHFSRVFKKITGMSANEYRNQI